VRPPAAYGVVGPQAGGVAEEEAGGSHRRKEEAKKRGQLKRGKNKNEQSPLIFCIDELDIGFEMEPPARH